MMGHSLALHGFPLGGRGAFLRQRRKFFPRALDNPLQVGQKVSVHRIRTRLEGFDCLFTAGDQDSEQSDFLLISAMFDLAYLPRYTAAETKDSRFAIANLRPLSPSRPPALEKGTLPRKLLSA
jgi:hypothetical protein